MSHSPEALFDLYAISRRIRRSQDILMEEYHPADEMRCPIHFCVGQESAPAALSRILRSDDVVMCHHRSHGYYLAKGAPLDDMIAEFYGKETGANGGLAGSMELSCGAANFFSGPILGGMFAMALGSAFKQKYGGEDAITVSVIGDGGMDEGIVYETINLAALRGLPILFVCENNSYSAHTRLDRHTVGENFVEKVRSFGLRAHLYDGNDPVLLLTELASIVGDIRRIGCPVFVEVSTYRMCGHVGPENDDVYGYRPEDEIRSWRERDPVAGLRKLLIARGIEAGKIAMLEKEIDDEVWAAIAKAKQAPARTFDEMLACNASDRTDAKADRLPVYELATFDGHQREARLAPY